MTVLAQSPDGHEVIRMSGGVVVHERVRDGRPGTKRAVLVAPEEVARIPWLSDREVDRTMSAVLGRARERWAPVADDVGDVALVPSAIAAQIVASLRDVLDSVNSVADAQIQLRGDVAELAERLLDNHHAV